MMIQKLIDKYMNLLKRGYETITLSQVISDLRCIQRRPIKKQNLMEAGDKNILLTKWLNEFARKYHKSLLPETTLRRLATSSLYKLSPKQQEYTINKAFKEALSKLKEI